jgi:hypothetical protein
LPLGLHPFCISSKGKFTENQFRRGKIAVIMEDELTMESILRTLRELYADPKDAPDPKALPIPEGIERAIRE